VGITVGVLGAQRADVLCFGVREHERQKEREENANFDSRHRFGSSRPWSSVWFSFCVSFRGTTVFSCKAKNYVALCAEKHSAFFVFLVCH